MTRWISAAEVPPLLRPGMTVFLPGGMSEPKTLTEELARQPEACRGVHFVETRLPGFRSETYRDADCTVTTFFLTPELAEAQRAGKVRFVPLHYRDTWDYLCRLEFDMALLELAPTGNPASVSLGLTCDFVPAVLPRSKTVVAEINRALPSPKSAPTIALERLDWAVESRRPPPSPAGVSSPESQASGRRVAAHVASLIRDGDCLQTGIGAIPDAVLRALHDRRGLGCHSGLIGDGVLELALAGALTGERKTRDRGRVVTGFAYGSQRLYDWVSGSGLVDLRAVDYTHDLRILAELDDFVAINSALEVDLLGQVNAEMIDGRQVSGTGGALDFARGAARSRGGRSIVALSAVAQRGTRSRIVAELAAGTAVTTPRADADFVVTEHGVAPLRGRSVEERAEALIEIAAPEFREQLREQLREW